MVGDAGRCHLVRRHHWQLHLREIVHVGVVGGWAVVLARVGGRGLYGVRVGAHGRVVGTLHARLVLHHVAHGWDAGRRPDGCSRGGGTSTAAHTAAHAVGGRCGRAADRGGRLVARGG